MDWVFGTLQVLIGAVALYIAWVALKVARDSQRIAAEQHERDDARLRLDALHRLARDITQLAFQTQQKDARTATAVPPAGNVADASSEARRSHQPLSRRPLTRRT